jgi:hypothetical protein
MSDPLNGGTVQATLVLPLNRGTYELAAQTLATTNI